MTVLNFERRVRAIESQVKPAPRPREPVGPCVIVLVTLAGWPRARYAA
jgi:hypothetical protein